MPDEPQPKHLQGSGVLLIGTPGSGKTYSLSTLVSAGLETFVISTDPGGPDSLLDAMNDPNLFGPIPIPTNATGTATLPVTIPNNATLKGLGVYLQVAGTDAQGFTLSNGIEVRICN